MAPPSGHCLLGCECSHPTQVVGRNGMNIHRPARWRSEAGYITPVATARGPFESFAALDPVPVPIQQDHMQVLDPKNIGCGDMNDRITSPRIDREVDSLDDGRRHEMVLSQRWFRTPARDHAHDLPAQYKLTNRRCHPFSKVDPKLIN
jgi:hypothetical protein